MHLCKWKQKGIHNFYEQILITSTGYKYNLSLKHV